MVWIPAGEFTMGSDAAGAWPDEGPTHRVFVDGFWMDEHEVTNAEFRRFVEASAYVTTAERRPAAEEILRQSPPGTPPPSEESLVAGSLVFTSPDGPVPLDDYARRLHPMVDLDARGGLETSRRPRQFGRGER
jgi:formylglycine-generating enzyme required for sulfatase activity